MTHDLARIKLDLARRIDELVARLFPAAARDGKYFSLGSIAGDPGQSLKIWRNGHKQGEWHDFSAGEGGGPLELIVRARCGGDVGAAIRWAADWLGHKADESPQERERRARVAQAAWDAKQARAARDLVKARARARGHWLAGAPLAGTPAETYLAGRGIDLGLLARPANALRFRDMVDAETGEVRPCLLAAVCDPDGFLTVHRIFLCALADGRVVKASDDPVAPMADAKKLYCNADGGCISLARGASGRPLPHMPAGEWITATEGIEDALSLAIFQPERRVIAAVTLGNLGKLRLPSACGGLYWHRHRGDGPQAVADYERQRGLLEARGLELRDIWAPEPFKDFNDWLQAQKGSV